MKLLEDLFYGELSPNVKSYEGNEQFEKALETIDQNEGPLKENLSEADFSQVQRLLDAQEEIISICSCENFLDGFRMGARLMLEILTPHEV